MQFVGLGGSEAMGRPQGEPRPCQQPCGTEPLRPNKTCRRGRIGRRRPGRICAGGHFHAPRSTIETLLPIFTSRVPFSPDRLALTADRQGGRGGDCGRDTTDDPLGRLHTGCLTNNTDRPAAESKEPPARLKRR